jgi:hypothetical protein
MNRLEKAFEFAADASKQMIALATGTIALTITFLKDVLNDPAARAGALQWAWLAFGTSVGFGLWFLLALTGSLGSKRISDDALTINAPNAQFPMWGQLLTFLVGLLLTIVFGMTGLRGATGTSRDTTTTSTPIKTRSEVSKLLSVGPFADADTSLQEGQWSAVTQQLADSINAYRSRRLIEGILLLGGVDQRPLSPVAALRFSTNHRLADARADALRARLRHLVGDTIGIFQVALGALSLGPKTKPAELSDDRRVDVYLITRAIR